MLAISITIGKGGLNRILLTNVELQCSTNDTQSEGVTLPSTDRRSVHIRTILSQNPDPAATLTLHIAVENTFLHDEAIATINPDESVTISIPKPDRYDPNPLPPVILLVAMQRPKLIGRVLEAAAIIGVMGICVVAASKVEKSYWDCKLFRNEGKDIKQEQNGEQNNKATKEASTNAPSAELPGRLHMFREENAADLSMARATRRVDILPAVRRRLETGLEQACCDGSVPWVYLEKRGVHAALEGVLKKHIGKDWQLIVAHPGAKHSVTKHLVNKQGSGAVLAIGPEGGWTDAEVRKLTEEMGFETVGLGTRTLRSETAAMIGLGLVHEGLRLAKHVQSQEKANGVDTEG